MWHWHFRWRKLEGSDPSAYEMIQKVQTLQKRLIAKTEEVVEADLLIQEKEKLYVELKNILARQPGPEVAEQLSIYQVLPPWPIDLPFLLLLDKLSVSLVNVAFALSLCAFPLPFPFAFRAVFCPLPLQQSHNCSADACHVAIFVAAHDAFDVIHHVLSDHFAQVVSSRAFTAAKLSEVPLAKPEAAPFQMLVRAMRHSHSMCRARTCIAIRAGKSAREDKADEGHG